MALITPDSTWPLRGLGYFLAHPRLWLAPLVATVIGWVGVLGIASLVLWWQWPDAKVEGFWTNLWALTLAFGWSGVTLILSWLALIPLLIGFAYEALSRRVLAQQAVALGEERTLKAMQSAVIVLVHNLGWMILWPVLAVACNLLAFFVPLLSPVLAPLGLFIGQFGLAHIAVLEGGDVALGSRGVPGARRWRLLREHRSQVFSAALVGAVLSLLLGFTFVGWLLFMPAMFTGAALWIAGWQLPEAATEPAASALPAPDQTEPAPSALPTPGQTGS